MRGISCRCTQRKEDDHRLQSGAVDFMQGQRRINIRAYIVEPFGDEHRRHVLRHQTSWTLVATRVALGRSGSGWVEPLKIVSRPMLAIMGDRASDLPLKVKRACSLEHQQNKYRTVPPSMRPLNSLFGITAMKRVFTSITIFCPFVLGSFQLFQKYDPSYVEAFYGFSDTCTSALYVYRLSHLSVNTYPS